jgi:hypothetical protein
LPDFRAAGQKQRPMERCHSGGAAQRNQSCWFTRSCPLPLHLPRYHLPRRSSRQHHVGGVAGCGGGDRHQCPRLPRGAGHRLGRTGDSEAKIFYDAVGARSHRHTASDLRCPRGSDGGYPADVPELLLASTREVCGVM